MRIIFAIYTLIVVFWSLTNYILSNDVWNWFTFFTHWGFFINTTYFWSISILHYKLYNSNVNNNNTDTPAQRGKSSVISQIDTLKVGNIVEVLVSKDSFVYTIKSEEGKVYENVSIDTQTSEVFIHSTATRLFNKSNQSGEQEV